MNSKYRGNREPHSASSIWSFVVSLVDTSTKLTFYTIHNLALPMLDRVDAQLHQMNLKSHTLASLKNIQIAKTTQ